jgi:hypothetical protein
MDERRRGTVAAALVLILLGVLLLVLQFAPGVRNWFTGELGWPLIVVAVGVFLAVIGLATGASGMMIPACIVGGIGALLYWQNLTGNWGSWAYAWTLIPGFAGVGTILHGLLSGRWPAVRAGMWQVFVSAVLFGIFASFLGGYTPLGQYWPVLIILLGVMLLVRRLIWPRE